jgi:protein-tyrosine phosphatase
MWERWGMDEVLFVCTGNLCRSPSAALLLRRQLSEAGRDDVTVHSAGTVGADVGPPRLLVQESRAFGIDLGAHTPRTVDPGMIEAADVVVGLTREHVRQTVLAVPPSFPRTFTLREIVRRGLRAGPRGAAEDLGGWLARLHDGRRPADLMGESPDDGVVDPLGGRRDDYRRMLTEVSALTQTLRDLAWPSSQPPAAGYGAAYRSRRQQRNDLRAAEKKSR